MTDNDNIQTTIHHEIHVRADYMRVAVVAALIGILAGLGTIGIFLTYQRQEPQKGLVFLNSQSFGPRHYTLLCTPSK